MTNESIFDWGAHPLFWLGLSFFVLLCLTYLITLKEG
jgi:hypothetical protein